MIRRRVIMFLVVKKDARIIARGSMIEIRIWYITFLRSWTSKTNEFPQEELNILMYFANN